MTDPARAFNHAKWQGMMDLENAFPMKCAFCGREVGVHHAYVGSRGRGSDPAVIYICPVCKGPNAYAQGTYRRYPESLPGPPSRSFLRASPICTPKSAPPSLRARQLPLS